MRRKPVTPRELRALNGMSDSVFRRPDELGERVNRTHCEAMARRGLAERSGDRYRITPDGERVRRAALGIREYDSAMADVTKSIRQYKEQGRATKRRRRLAKSTRRTRKQIRKHRH